MANPRSSVSDVPRSSVPGAPRSSAPVSSWEPDIRRFPLTVYERTKIIARRTQQLDDGFPSLLSDAEARRLANSYEIAAQEFRKELDIPLEISRYREDGQVEFFRVSDLYRRGRRVM